MLQPPADIANMLYAADLAAWGMAIIGAILMAFGFALGRN